MAPVVLAQGRRGGSDQRSHAGSGRARAAAQGTGAALVARRGGSCGGVGRGALELGARGRLGGRDGGRDTGRRDILEF